MFLKATTRHVHRRQDLVLDDLVEVLAGFLGHQKLGNEVAASRVAPVRAGHISDLYRFRSGRLGSGKSLDQRRHRFVMGIPAISAGDYTGAMAEDPRSEEHTSELQSLMRS